MRRPSTRTLAKAIVVLALLGSVALLFLAPSWGARPFLAAMIIALIAIQVVRLAH